MKKIFKILISIIILIAVIVAGGIFYLNNRLEAGSKIEMNGLVMSNINDGIYNGNYKSGRWSNELKVTVKNNKITDIKIIDDVDFVQEGIADELFKRVIEVQNTKVDSVSGATVTSKAYLKSIENAFPNNN